MRRFTTARTAWRLVSPVVALAGALALSGCYDDGYGYGGAYGGGGYYGNGLYGDGVYGDSLYGGLYPGYGWYDGFYYPGAGYYRYDRQGGRHRWSGGVARDGRRADGRSDHGPVGWHGRTDRSGSATAGGTPRGASGSRPAYSGGHREGARGARHR